MAIREFLQKVFGWSINLMVKKYDYKYRFSCLVNLYLIFLQHLNASFSIHAYKIFSMAFWQKSLILFAFNKTKTLKFL